MVALSAASIPLSQYRNWVLSQLDPEGSLVGLWALLLLFTQIVPTFFLFGASTVLSFYMAKLRTGAERSSFVAGYAAVSLAMLLTFFFITACWPGLLTWALGGDLPPGLISWLLILAPLIWLWNLLSYVLAGAMSFRLVAIQSVFQTLVISAYATAAWMIEPALLLKYPLATLCSTLALTLLIMIVWSIVALRGVLSRPHRISLPPGFWRYSLPIHVDTIASFVRLSLDQLFVLAAVDIRELGIYFVASQISTLVSFVPTRAILVAITSLSVLVHDGQYEAFVRSYRRLVDASVDLGLACSLLLIALSRPILSVFGSTYADHHLYLVYLVAIGYVGVVAAANSAAVSATGRTGGMLIVNTIFCTTQIALSVALLKILDPAHAVMAVIGARAAAVALAQAAMGVWIRFTIEGVGSPFSASFFGGLAVVGLAAAAQAIQLPQLSLLICVVGFGIYVHLTRYRFFTLVSHLRLPRPRQS